MAAGTFPERFRAGFGTGGVGFGMCGQGMTGCRENDRSFDFSSSIFIGEQFAADRAIPVRFRSGFGTGGFGFGMRGQCVSCRRKNDRGFDFFGGISIGEQPVTDGTFPVRFRSGFGTGGFRFGMLRQLVRITGRRIIYIQLAFPVQADDFLIIAVENIRTAGREDIGQIGFLAVGTAEGIFPGFAASREKQTAAGTD